MPELNKDVKIRVVSKRLVRVVYAVSVVLEMSVRVVSIETG